MCEMHKSSVSSINTGGVLKISASQITAGNSKNVDHPHVKLSSVSKGQRGGLENTD